MLIKIFILSIIQFFQLFNAVKFYPFGESNGDRQLAKQDDAFTTIQIGIPFPFFGEVFSQLHISTNGIIFFGQGSTSYTPITFPLNQTKCVAAYWTNSDPSRGGEIFFRETLDILLLKNISTKIKSVFIEQNDFEANWGLIVTYSNVSRYGCRNCSYVVNHQTILISNGIKSFVIFLYKKLDYTNGQIGFNAGDLKRYYLVENSNTNLINETALTKSNVGIPGEWIFSISHDIRSSCSSDGLLEIFPRKLAHFGNEEFFIGGICQELNDTLINIKLEKETIICGILNNPLRFRCRLPYINKIGKLDLMFTVNNITYNSFLVIHGMDDNNFVYQNIDYIKANNGDDVSIKWNKNLTEKPVAILGYEINLYLSNSFKAERIDKIPIEYNDIENTGVFSLSTNKISKSSINSIAFKIIQIMIRVNPLVALGSTIYIYYDSGLACRNWYDLQPSQNDIEKIKENSRKENPCQPSVPLNFPSVLPNSFEKDSACTNLDNCKFFHPGARSCYRSINNIRTNGVATQCCYDNSGTLILSPPGGGTLDFTDSSDSILGHFAQDVYPYFLCCKITNQCDLYYEKRPIIDSNTNQNNLFYKRMPMIFWEPPQPRPGGGDPHFTTLDGFEYDFNPIGEFIYLKTADTVIQARIRQYKNNNGILIQACYFSDFAIQYQQSNLIQVSLNHLDTLMITIDKTQLNQGYWNFGDFSIDYSNAHTVSIQLKSNVNILITAHAKILNIITIPSASLKGKISGLIGNWDNDINNDLMLPNGSFISINSTSEKIHWQFGMKWSTTASTSIFSYPDGLAWSDYQDPSFIPIFEIPNQNNVCGTNKNCLFDLYVTGDETLALGNIRFQNQTNEIREELQLISETCTKPSVLHALNNYTVENGIHKYSFVCENGYKQVGGNYMECYKGNYTGSLGSCYKDLKDLKNSVPRLSATFVHLMIFAMIFANIK